MSMFDDVDIAPQSHWESISVADRYWRDCTGKVSEFKDLETSHLKNILRRLEEGGANVPIMLLVELRIREV